MLGKILSASRYMMLLPVVGCLISALVLTLYEFVVIFYKFAQILRGAIVDPKDAKMFAVGLIEAVDIFLIAIAIYIIGLGLYALFINEKVNVPDWLKIADLDDLKANLISVVIAVLAVLFLREAIAWNGTENLQAFGVSIAAVVASLTLFLLKSSAPPK